jgi:uncharacterized membrane protein
MIQPPRKGASLSLILVLICVVLGSFGQIALGKGMTGVSLGSGSTVAALFSALLRPYVAIGFILYFASSILWLLVLSREEVSYVYPLIALTYVFVGLLSWLLLHQQVPLLRWLGILLICVGVGIVALAPGPKS